MEGATMMAIRKSRGLSQKELAGVLNLRFNRKYDDKKVSRWENGSEAIPADVAGQLSLDSLKYTPTKKCTVVSVCGQKGGIGKSTISLALGHVLTKSGARVLLVDCDSQANLTMGCGIGHALMKELDAHGRTHYHALVGRIGLPEIIRDTSLKGMRIVPSSIQLAVAERELVERELVDGFHERLKEVMISVPLSETERAAVVKKLSEKDVHAVSGANANGRLRELLRDVKNDFDFVLIDCMPSLATLTMNALHASDLALIPCQPETFAIVGLKNLTDTIAGVRRRNPALRILGVIPSMYNARQSQDRASLDDIRNFAKAADAFARNQEEGVRVFEPIPRSTAYAQASAISVILHEEDPGAPGLQTFIELAEALGVNADLLKAEG